MRFTALTAISVALLGLVGCGHDGGGEPDAGPPPVDQCLSDPDIAIVNSILEVPDGGLPDAGRSDGLLSADLPDMVAVYVEDCVTNTCQTEVIYQTPELASCMTDCLNGTPTAGLSWPCLSCWLEIIDCAISLCPVECLGADRTMCDACTVANCNPRFYECSGYDPPPT